MGSPPQRTVGKRGEDGGEGRKRRRRWWGMGAAPSSADRAGCRLCAGVGVVVCVGGAVASLDGETDLILPLLLLLLLLHLLLQLLLLLEGTSLHSVFGGHGRVAARPVLLQGRAPLWMCSASVLQPLRYKEKRGHIIQSSRNVGGNFRASHLKKSQEYEGVRIKSTQD